MKLLVGLGNPGARYDRTRHNVGFRFLDYLAAEEGIVFGGKWQAQVAKARLWGHQVILAKPETFMNNSGQAVGRIVSYFGLDPADVIVVHDDLDLDLGRVKLVVNRGAGGHNGVLSIISHLHSREFARFRFGIGRPPAAMPVSRYVLARFAAEENEVVEAALPRLADGVRQVLEQGVTKAMNSVNAAA